MNNDRFIMHLRIYPQADCGEDYSKGDPCEISITGNGVGELKSQTKEVLLHGLREQKFHSGKCFLEQEISLICSDGDEIYLDSDEGEIVVRNDFKDVDFLN